MEVMTMLMGKFNHAIDAKGRLIIPAKIKEQLGQKITVLKGTDNCLRLYSEEEWALYAEKISALPPTQSRAITRYLYSNALEVEPDAQGRVILPQDMLDFAGITKNVVTAGC
jgi:MraZ protein